MCINDIIENEELKKLLNSSIEKTYNKYKLFFIIEKEDFIQETYIFIMKRLKSFDNEKSTLKTYLPMLVMSSARNCIQFANGQSKKHNKLQLKNNTISLDYEFINQESTHNTFKELVGNTVDDVYIKLLIDEILQMEILSERQKQIILLMSKGYTSADISKILDKTVSSINITFYRAKEKIVRKYAY